MLPSNLEYLCLLGVLAVSAAAILLPELEKLVFKNYFWVSFAIYMLACTSIDFIAVEAGWWVFSPDKVAGIVFLNLPVEEYVLFVLIFLFTVGIWEILDK